MKNGLMLTARFIKANLEEEFLKDISTLRPDQVVIFAQEPTDMIAFEPFMKNQSFQVAPMFKFPSFDPDLLAGMAAQVLENVKEKDLFLLVDVASQNPSFPAYFEKFVRVLSSHNINGLCIYIVAQASDFNSVQTPASYILRYLKQMGAAFDITYGIAPILSNVENSMAILAEKKFSDLVIETQNVCFFLTKIGGSKDWDISSILFLKKDVVFWSIPAFIEHMPVTDLEESSIPLISDNIPAGAIGEGIPQRDRISVFDDMDLKGNCVRKISIGGETEYIMEMEQRGNKKVGRLHSGGYVDMIHFAVRFLK